MRPFRRILPALLPILACLPATLTWAEPPKRLTTPVPLSRPPHSPAPIPVLAVPGAPGAKANS